MSEQHPNLLIENTISETWTAGREIVPAAKTLPALRSAAAHTPKASRHPLRKLLLIGASILAVAGATYFGWDYWTVGRFQVSTDDAYVKADNTTIAPKVSGYIAGVLVGDLPIRLKPTATRASVRPCSWTFTSVAIFGSHNRFQSFSDFFPTTRPAPPTWRRLAGAAGSFAPIVRWRESRSASLIDPASCAAASAAVTPG